MEQELPTLPEHPKVLVGFVLSDPLLCVCFVDRCLFFVIFLLAIVFSVLLRFMNSYYPSVYSSYSYMLDKLRGHRGRMVVGFTTTCTISAYHH